MLALVVLLCPAVTLAQDSAQADSLATTGGDTLSSNMTLAEMAELQSAGSQSAEAEDLPTSFFIGLDSNAKVGISFDVRVNRFYGELKNDVAMRGGSTFNNTAKWSWDDFRQQEKTVDARNERFLYNSGSLLPFKLSTSGSWDWSEDNTINTAGFENLSKRDFKTGNIQLNKPKFDIAGMNAILKSSVGTSDQKAVNRDQRNDFTEAFLDGGAQLGRELVEGVALATNVYGKTISGDKTLGDSASPSTANSDSLGVGVYFERGIASGRLTIARSNFEEKYLDYKRNSTGQIDTVGLDEFDKVIDELKTTDAVSVEFENQMRVGRLGFRTSLSRDADELAYQASGVGSKERQSDKARLGLTFATSRDSFSLDYNYLWKWDDQRIKNATINRGRQYIKNRDLDFFYGRRLFKDTDFSLKYHTGLGQDIAQNQFNSNDKDRLNNDLSLQLGRDWRGKFSVDLLFAYKQSEDVAIRSTSSANNNLKDSYEVSPGYRWPLADWLTLRQTYRIYIQYTDYVYSDLEQVTREDDYSKRGNLNSIVVIKPSDRLEVAIRHDYNKRSSAVKTATDALGRTTYFTKQKQAINKIDLGATFKLTEGVTIEAATFRTRDFKEIFGTTVNESEVFSGEVWVGAKVDQGWGANDALVLSAIIKKYNAFGPSVTEESSDYWEADVSLHWGF
jgi:hypothetical protein